MQSFGENSIYQQEQQIRIELFNEEVVLDFLKQFKKLNGDSFTMERKNFDRKEYKDPDETFKPNILKKSAKIDNQSKLLRLQNSRHFRPGEGPQIVMNGSYQSQKYQQGIQKHNRYPLSTAKYIINNRFGQEENERNYSLRHEKLFNYSKEYQIKRQNKYVEQKSEEFNQCTFRPALRKNTKYEKKINQSMDQKNFNTVYERLWNKARNKTELKDTSANQSGIFGKQKYVEPSWKLKEEEELKECSFRPKLLKSSKKQGGLNESISQAQIFQKGSKMHVSRMREEYKRKVDKQNLFDKMGKPTMKRSSSKPTQPNPFDFKTSSRGTRKLGQKQPLVTFEVMVAKGKVGKLIIYTENQIQDRIRDFSRTYGLNRSADVELREKVIQSLEQHQNNEMDIENSQFVTQQVNNQKLSRLNFENGQQELVQRQISDLELNFSQSQTFSKSKKMDNPHKKDDTPNSIKSLQNYLH